MRRLQRLAAPAHREWAGSPGRRSRRRSGQSTCTQRRSLASAARQPAPHACERRTPKLQCRQSPRAR
eukprot:6455531-Prymnesium_polylepis.2